MGTIASQITSFRIVYLTVYSEADQRKYQSSASLAFVWRIHRRPVNSPHKWPVTRKMFPFDDVIMMVGHVRRGWGPRPGQASLGMTVSLLNTTLTLSVNKAAIARPISPCCHIWVSSAGARRMKMNRVGTATSVISPSNSDVDSRPNTMTVEERTSSLPTRILAVSVPAGIFRIKLLFG